MSIGETNQDITKFLKVFNHVIYQLKTFYREKRQIYKRQLVRKNYVFVSEWRFVKCFCHVIRFL